jgi:D-alanine-D-alanine ligase
MSRVDVFLKKDGGIVVNEINTIPGFTSISMYPKLWEWSGLSYSDLIDTLIDLGMKRFERDKALKTVC